MKKYLIKLFVFLLLMVFIDQLGGRILEKFYFSTKSSYPAKHRYVAHDATDDIIVYGSSRTYRHYNPGIITQESGISSYNAGMQGNGIVFAHGMYIVSRNHYTPKIALIDIFYEYDFRNLFDNTRYLDLLKPFYGESADLQEYFKKLDPASSIKMISMLFRFNSQIFSILKNQREGISKNEFKGFEPELGSTLNDNEPRGNLTIDSYIDPVKKSVLEETIELMKKDGVKPILVFSPIWYNVEHLAYRDSIGNIAKRHDVEFWDYSTSENFSSRDFYDFEHLNSQGAEKFSRLIGKRLIPLRQ